jgi:hypothetical protein
VARGAQGHRVMQLFAGKAGFHPFVTVAAARDKVVPGTSLHDPPTQSAGPAVLVDT